MPSGIGPSHQQKQPRRFPTIWHLICIATVAVLAASGLVSIENLLVVVLSTVYLLFLSTFSFPAAANSSPEPPIFKNRILPLYILFTGVIGLLLPIIYVFHAIYDHYDNAAVTAAASHLFLLSTQVFWKNQPSSTSDSTDRHQNPPLKVKILVPY